MVPLPLRRLAIRGSQERIHFRLLQVRNDRPGTFLEWNQPDLTAPCNVLQTVSPHKASQRVDGRQSLVAGSSRTLSGLLQMGEKGANQIRRQVHYREPVHRFAQLFSCKWKEKEKRIAVAALRVARQVAFVHEVFEEKAPNPDAEEVTHGVPPGRSVRSAGWLPAIVRASWSDTAGWQRYANGRDRLPAVARGVAHRRLAGTT